MNVSFLKYSDAFKPVILLFMNFLSNYKHKVFIIIFLLFYFFTFILVNCVSSQFKYGGLKAQNKITLKRKLETFRKDIVNYWNGIFCFVIIFQCQCFF